MPKFAPISVHDLGDYLREQRHSARLSLRQLSEVAGISNPYLSQIERGLKKPSAEILQALAKALRISAESLYVRAGFLEARTDLGEPTPVDVTAAILADPRLSDRQRSVLLDVYESFLAEPGAGKAAKVSTTAKAKDTQDKGTTAATAHPAPSSAPDPSDDPTATTKPSTTKPTQKSHPKEKQA